MKHSGKMKARMKMLKMLKDEMLDEMGEGAGLAEKLEGMKKVTVASDSEEGLKEGLSKAQQILDKKKMMESMGDYEEKKSKKKRS